MRLPRASITAFLAAVAILSLGARDASAQTLALRTPPDPRLGRTRALDALFAEVSHISPDQWDKPSAQPDPPAKIRPNAKSARTEAKEPKAASVAYVDEATTWILPPEAPPEAIETAGVLQCVPYARFMSGIGLRGDAWTWWDKASGIYARGNYPEPGAVLSFPGIDRMPLGHVAVVTQVLSARRTWSTMPTGRTRSSSMARSPATSR